MRGAANPIANDLMRRTGPAPSIHQTQLGEVRGHNAMIRSMNKSSGVGTMYNDPRTRGILHESHGFNKHATMFEN